MTNCDVFCVTSSQGKKKKRKPKVIGKPLPTKMSEDGSEWGERCIDIYEIVDKVGEGMLN